MVKPKHIAVVGSGAAGMASALFLHKQGHRVTLFEKTKNPRPVGAGVLLQPAGMFVLAQLGLLEKFIQKGRVIHRLYGENQAGAKVLNLVYDDFHKGSYGLGIHRGSIFNIFLEEICREGIPYVTDCRVDNLKRLSGGKVQLYKADEDVGVFDGMVLADGRNSKLRAEFNIKQSVHNYKWGALWAIIEDEKRLLKDELRQVYKTTKKIAGILPIGAHPETGVQVASLFWSLRNSKLASWRSAGLDHWKEEVVKLYPGLETLLKKITSPEQILFASYSHIKMQKWHDENLVCIGDAAHAMSPQLGQGVSLGLYDAWSLSQCFEKTATTREAFREYSKSRKSHIRWIQFVSKLVTPMFQSSHSGWAPYRDVTFSLIHNFSFTYRLMLGTLSGTRRGVLKKSEKHLKDFLKSMPGTHAT